MNYQRSSTTLNKSCLQTFNDVSVEILTILFFSDLSLFIFRPVESIVRYIIPSKLICIVKIRRDQSLARGHSIPNGGEV